MTEPEAETRRGGGRRLAIITSLTILLLLFLVFAVAPIALKRAPGWTGVLVLGTYPNQGESGPPMGLCPLTLTDDHGVAQQGHPVQDGGSLWTRFDVPPGHYVISNPNIHAHDVTVWPLTHTVIDSHDDFGCVSNGLNP